MSMLFVTGSPGTGKTALAVSKLIDIYDSKDRVIFTNINLRVDYDDYIKPLDVSDLYTFAKHEFALYEKYRKLSTEYNERVDIYNIESATDLIDTDDEFSKYVGNYDLYLKDSGLLDVYGHSYIAWDECQVDLEENDPVWIRFFSYHRHFNMDIILITQNLTLVHRKYKAFGELFYFARSSKKRYFSNVLRYDVYTNYTKLNKDFIETQSIQLTSHIKNFYDSGHYDTGKTLLLKFLFLPFLLIGLLFLFYKFFFIGHVVNHDSNSAVSKIDDNRSTSLNKTVVPYDVNRSKSQSSVSLADSNHIMFFTCTLETCTIKNSSFSVPLSTMFTFTQALKIDILYSSKINNYYSLVAVSVPESVFNDLMRFDISKKGDKHINDKMDFTNNTSLKN